jgi:predicted signal transduction protein with EAL and GGDEF domain
MRPSTPSPLGAIAVVRTVTAIIGHLMVESEAILKRVRALGISFAQDYIYARRTEADRAHRLVQNREIKAAMSLHRTAPGL